MFSTFLVIIIVICLVAIAIIVGRKFSALKAVNTKTAPVIQQMDVKRKLLEQRLQRHLKDGGSKAYTYIKPLVAQISVKLRQLYQKLFELEENYRHKVLKSSFKDKVVQEQKVDEILKQAEDFIDKENFADAEKKYVEALTLDDKSYQAYQGLGQLYLLQKDYEHAKETFEFLLKLNQEDPFIYRSLGEIAAGRGDLKSAEDEYIKSLELDNKDIASYLDLAEVYLNLDEPRKAFEVISQAAAIEPRNPKILDFLIEVCIILQDKVAARKALRQLSEANPENQKLSEFKERIGKI